MRRIIAAITILLSAVLLFTRLGHYALWDDEAVTALAGKGVWQTGDTSVVMGHNIVAYRSGLLLKGLYERSTPPLGAYIAAPFVGLSNEPFAARLPFALIALGSVGVILYWLYTINAAWLTWLLVSMALIGNVSLWLFCRQCRYYSPVIFSSIAIAYLYLNWNGGRTQLILLALASLVLLAGNYLNYLALQLCIVIDYTLVGRKRRVLNLRDWLILLLPQVAIGSFIVLTWNTLGTGNLRYLQGNTMLQRLELIWMNLRDINRCEFGSGLLLLAAPALYAVTQKAWLIRAPLVLVGYIVVISILSPQLLTPIGPYPPPTEADIRYLTPVIPLCIGIGVLVLLEAARISKWLAIGLAVVAFGFNLFNGAPLTTEPMPLRSTLVTFVGELAHPPDDPYTAEIEWVRQNVAEGQSVWVQPDFACYPLMYGAPHAIYAWQIKAVPPPPPALMSLPPIHYAGLVLPDFIVSAGGPYIDGVVRLIQENHLPYRLVDYRNVFSRDMTRPELFWHSFEPIPASMEEKTGIFFFKRQP